MPTLRRIRLRPWDRRELEGWVRVRTTPQRTVPSAQTADVLDLATAGFHFGIVAALVGVSSARARQRQRPRYRLIAPTGL